MIDTDSSPTEDSRKSNILIGAKSAASRQFSNGKV
jgi:hypothetical protein